MKNTTKRMNRPERMDAVANGALKLEGFWVHAMSAIRNKQGNWTYNS